MQNIEQEKYIIKSGNCIYIYIYIYLREREREREREMYEPEWKSERRGESSLLLPFDTLKFKERKH